MVSVQPGRKGQRVQRGLPVRLVPPALPVLPVLTEPQERTELLVPMEWQARKVRSGQRGPQAMTVRRVSRGLRVRMGNRVWTVRMVP